MNTTAGMASGSNATRSPAMASTATRAFVRRLVREHRLADDVADRVDRRLGRAPRAVDLDEAARVHLHLRLVEPGHRGIRPAADRDEHAIERAFLAASARQPSPSNVTAMPFFASFMPTTLVFSSTASQIDSIRFARMLTRSRSAPGSRPAGHLDDRHLGAERGVDAAQLEPDVAAADDQQRLRNVGQIQRAGGVHQPRAVDGQARDRRRPRAGRDDRVLEGQRRRLRLPVPPRDVERVRVAEAAVPWM